MILEVVLNYFENLSSTIENVLVIIITHNFCNIWNHRLLLLQLNYNLTENLYLYDMQVIKNPNV